MNYLDSTLNKLAKWRSFFAAWQLGTRSDTDPECAAIKEHREATLLLRAEVSALLNTLVAAGVIKLEDFRDHLVFEAKALDTMLERQYPGFSTTSMGLSMEPQQALETMRKMHFKD